MCVSRIHYQTNMDISTTPKRKDAINHAPVPQAEEEHDTELTVIVTPPAASLKPILKHSNTLILTGSQPPPTTFGQP